VISSEKFLRKRLENGNWRIWNAILWQHLCYVAEVLWEISKELCFVSVFSARTVKRCVKGRRRSEVWRFVSRSLLADVSGSTARRHVPDATAPPRKPKHPRVDEIFISLPFCLSDAKTRRCVCREQTAVLIFQEPVSLAGTHRHLKAIKM